MYCNINTTAMRVKNATAKMLLLSAIFLLTGTAQAQNINSPNRRGPLGTQVNTLSGNFFLPRTDFYVSARAINLNASFYYNSYLFQEEYGYGKGWTFEYDIKYKADTLPGGRIIMWGNGREDTYDSIPGGTYQAPRGFFSILTQYQQGKYVLTGKDGIKTYFDNPTHRKVTRIEEPNGNYINFSYTDSLLTSMTNGAGQTITLTYTQGRLASVVDAIATPARTFTYTYDAAGNLKEVKDPLNGKYKYEYLINGPLRSVTDKNNNKVDVIYFPDLAARELIGCNKRISFSYDTAKQSTTVTDHLTAGNQVTRYTYKRLGQLSWITSVSGNCCGFNVNYEYDDQGNMLKMTDANGKIYTYTYDTKGNVLTATDPAGGKSIYTYTSTLNKISTYKDANGNLYTMTYDADGNLTQLVAPGNNIYKATYSSSGDILTSTDAKGNVFTYHHDAYGNPSSVTGPEGFTATLAHDARGNLLSYTDSRGYKSTAEYDILDRMKKISDPINNSEQFSYDAQGNIVSHANKNNETRLLSYDASNRLVHVADPVGNQSWITYDNMDNLTSIKNPLGSETLFTYDKRNRVSSIKDPEANSALYSYDNNGNTTSMKMPGGQLLQLTYDDLNRPVTIKDATGVIASYQYDKRGNLTRYVNETGAVTTATYDSLDRLKQFTDPLGNSTAYTYDKNNNVISISDAEGKTRNYTYDNMNRMKTFTDNNGFVITAGYDTEGNVISITDQNNNTTNYTYDSLNRRKRMTYPGGTYQEYVYDKKGNMVSVRLTDGGYITYQYDTLDRMKSRTLPGGEVYSYIYDAAGRVTSATNNSGTVSFTYDVMDRITSETFDGRTTSYTYNTAGRTKTIKYPDNSVVTKEFDTRGRLIKILKDSVLLASYEYNNANQLTAKIHGNGINSTYQYDYANRLNNITTGTVQNSQFTYDKMGNKKTIVKGDDNYSEQFTYDNGYRLTAYKRGPSATPVVQNTYTYDAVGNRAAADLNGTAVTYAKNSLNQLTSVNGTTLTYDNRGNLTYDGASYKTYDADNRLIKDSISPSVVVTYTYDALNRKVARMLNGDIRKYSYSGTEQIEERDGVGNLISSTVFNSFLNPVVNDKNGDRFYFHANEMGSVEGITNSNGRVIEKYYYDVYGKLYRFDSLNNPLVGSIAGNRFGYTGQEYDSVTGSYRFFYRNYSPETGLFNQRDLIEYEDGMGMYQYVGNNPANGIDVWGLEDCGKSFDFMKSWKTFSRTKFVYDYLNNYAETFNQAAKDAGLSRRLNLPQIPAPVKTGLSVISAGVNAYKTSQSVEKYSEATNATERAMHAGDAVKSGASLTAGLTGLTATQLGMKTVAKGASGYGMAITAMDIEAYFIAKYGIQDPLEIEAHRSEIEAELYMWQQGQTDEEKVERIMKLSQLKRIMDERERSKNNPCSDGSNRKGRWVWDPVKKMWVFLPVDPNLIIGPDGKDEKKWVSVKDRMPYTVLFENDSTATARARYVKITTPIEPKQDAATLELGNFGFNNQSFEVPKGLATYYERLDARDSTGVYVDVVAGYDVMKHEIFWEFRAIDPTTLMPPDDPLAGFLMLRDTANPAYGNGFVNFTMKPLTSAQTLDTIGARAFITFDENEVIPTNIHTNTIDAVAPTSQMLSVNTDANRRTTLTWSGVDDANGIGVDYYTIYVSNDRINYSILVPQIRRTDTTLVLPPDSVYCFFVLATDRVGNTETLRPNVSTCYSIGTTLPVTWLYFNGTTQGKNNILTWATGSETNTKEFSLERSLNGNTFQQITLLPAAGNSAGTREYKYTDPNIDRLNSERMYYRVKQVDLDGRFTYSRVVLLTYRENNSQPSVIYPNPTKGIVNILVGDRNMVGTEATLIDVNGRILQRVKITASNQSFDMSGLVNGIYFIKLANKETLRVIKQ